MFKFKNVYINNFYTVVSPKEANGNIKIPNEVIDDDEYGDEIFDEDYSYENFITDLVYEESELGLL